MQNSVTIKERPVNGNTYILLSVLILMTIGFGGYLLVSRETIALYVLAHLGALGILGLFGWAAGRIAVKKGRNFLPAFSMTSLLPIIAGSFGVLFSRGSITCGGSISLATAVLILILISCLGRKQ